VNKFPAKERLAMANEPMPPLPEDWGWFVPSPVIAAKLDRQLAVELSPGHLLDGKAVKVVGFRLGTDDILCRHESEPSRFTVIHLSWNRTEPGAGPRSDSDHPTVMADGRFDDFLAYEANSFP